jgi:hypothetical protein
MLTTTTFTSLLLARSLSLILSLAVVAHAVLIMMRLQSCQGQRPMHYLICGSTLALHKAAEQSEQRKQCSSVLQGYSLLYSAALAASVIVLLPLVAAAVALLLHTNHAPLIPELVQHMRTSMVLTPPRPAATSSEGA